VKKYINLYILKSIHANKQTYIHTYGTQQPSFLDPQAHALDYAHQVALQVLSHLNHASQAKGEKTFSDLEEELLGGQKLQGTPAAKEVFK
jgi:hypothetical protein